MTTHDVSTVRFASSEPYADLRAYTGPARPPLVRRRPRIFAGVARGLSIHLGGDVHVWRAVFVLLLPYFGLGLILYLIFALSLPSSEEALARKQAPRLARTLASRSADAEYGVDGEASDSSELASAGRSRMQPLFIIALALLAIILILWLGGIAGAEYFAASSIIPALLVISGAAVAWSYPMDKQSAPVSTTVIGSLMAAAGAFIFVAVRISFSQAILGVMTGGSLIAVMALVVIPVFVNNRNLLQTEREARIREGARADIAAHLHDSVLQMLSLIRARANEPEVVATLARSQERDLRRYLYSGVVDESESVAQQLHDVAGEIEENFRAQIDVVITGDNVPDESSRALVGATREALTNACKHAGGAPISLYAELGKRCEVFVRDRGGGFDLDEALAGTSAGIRESIIYRLEKVGGNAEFRTPLPTGGSEVRLTVERRDVEESRYSTQDSNGGEQDD